MKKLLASFLCIVMIAAFMPVMAFAENERSTGNIVYLDGTKSENGDGTETSPYNNFNSAIDSVEEGGRIKLIGDYEKESTSYDEFMANRVFINKNITLDLNNYNINLSGSFGWYALSVSSGVKATVMNGTINAVKSTQGIVTLASGAEADFVKCIVKGGGSKPAVKLGDNSTFNAEGSTFISAPSSYYGINGEAKKIYMKDCVVDGMGVTSSYHYGISVTSGDMTFEDCTISVTDKEDAVDLTVLDGATAIISGGEINGAIRAGWKSNGTLKISGDTLVNGQVVHVGNGDNNKASYINLAGGKYALTENLISVNDKVKGNVTVTGGVFKNETVVADFVKEPYKIIANIGTNKDDYPYTIQNIPAGTVACVGDKTYTSIDEAMAKANGNTVLLVADVKVDKLYGKINGNGKKITYNGTIKSLMDSDLTLTNANIVCSDADINNISVAGGKLNGGVVNNGNVDGFLKDNCFIHDETKSIEDVSKFEATIGKTGYTALTNAMSVAARSAEKETVVLQKNKTAGHEEIYPNANYTLDLNGHTMGSFLIVPLQDRPELIPNNADITIKDSSKDKTGKIISDDNFAIATNGTLENIKLTLDGISVESKSYAGIYFPSSGKLIVKNCNITGTSGVEIRGGEMEVENSNITATADEFKASENASGSTIEGAAIAVSQHSTNHPIKVNIKSGTFKGIKALYEVDLQDSKSDNINITVMGGNFKGKVESDNADSFITGGTFSEWPGEELVADKVLAVQKGDKFYIGSNANKVINESKPGDKITVIKSGEDALTVPEGVVIENKSGESIIVNGKEVDNGKSITATKPNKQEGNDDSVSDGSHNTSQESTNAPSTGDESNLIVFVMLFFVAALGIGVTSIAFIKKH
ncbi:hypothetical protein [Anaerofustis sp.]|uniref:hypothetical protein n=1 Tax=Anaerofustis sp. TaxID=1872517 RepID=UPI0025C1FFD4|nr:hypothetical protein [Anaerofustis sp.]